MIAEGEHKYGIVGITRYPNGSTYILVPFILFGIDDIETLRIVPLLLSAFVLSLFVFYFLKNSKTVFSTIFVLLAFISILLQPGIINWMGALNEHAHQMYMVFLIILAGYFIQDIKYVFLVFGFLCGWIGYDFIPAQILTMLIIRYIKYSQRKDDVINNLIISLKETLMGALGVVLAIIFHLIQNALYFGSVKTAFIDLFGSAEARMFLDEGKKLNPDYIEGLKAANCFKPFPGRFSILIGMLGHFIRKGWSRPITIILSLWMGILFNMKNIDLNRLSRKKYMLNLAIVSILSISSSIAWLVLVKYHAYFHFHILPRLFFVAYINLIVFMIISNEKYAEI